MVEIFGIVQDALAGIAGDDLVVASNLLEHLRTDPNLADLAHFVSRGCDTDSASMLSNPVVPRDEVGGD